MAGQSVFERRLQPRRDELEWLYMELYDDRARLSELEELMRRASGTYLEKQFRLKMYKRTNKYY